MEWVDEALVLSVRPHGETAAVAEFFTRDHGRHLAMVHGARSRRMRPLLQIGNHLDVTWKARLAEQLGFATVSLRRGFAAEAMNDRAALCGLTAISALTRLLAERDPHPNLFEVSLFVLGFLDDPTVWPALYVRWELALLDELGFGLDLTTCAVTGGGDDLAFVSPKTGRAVSRAAAAPYEDRLLVLPPFLLSGRRGAVTPEDIAAGLRLTGHFLESRVLESREMVLPDVRAQLPGHIARQRGREAPAPRALPT
ncbi:MAG: DNA repair protein RecO [Alphaproteobacteria bacterium]|nr:DNA repair protein RecO [Alphaproteobacteria bacterium]